MTTAPPSVDPNRVIASLARDQVNLDLNTVDLCFIAGLYLRADKAARPYRENIASRPSSTRSKPSSLGARRPRRRRRRWLRAHAQVFAYLLTRGDEPFQRYSRRCSTDANSLGRSELQGGLRLLPEGRAAVGRGLPPPQDTSCGAVASGRGGRGEMVRLHEGPCRPDPNGGGGARPV